MKSKSFYIGIIAFSLLLLTVNISLIFFQNSPPNQSETTRQVLGKNSQKQKEIEEEIAYWKNIVEKHHDFRDAYMKLAILYAKKGDKGKALFYLNKVLNLDPNYDAGKELKKSLEE